MLLLVAIFAACDTPPAPPAAPLPCRILAAPASGPLQEARLQAKTPLAQANLFIQEARLTGDAGFYNLAEAAVDCHLSTAPDDVEADQLKAYLDIQFHRFAAVETWGKDRTQKRQLWRDWMLLGDALMEQGKLDAAADAYQSAVNLRPSVELYDRIGWLRWLWGDVAGAMEMASMAARSASVQDPETWAWMMTRLGWLKALQNQPAPELELALKQLPDYPAARFARGRLRLAQGDTAGAAEDLRAAGATVEATRALAEIDPSVSVETVKNQDGRGYAIYIAERDPSTAQRMLEEEWKLRQDAATQMARAYVGFRLGQDTAAEARAALATGIVEPRVLLQGGLILKDRALLDRALAMGPGLLPSERRMAEAP